MKIHFWAKLVLFFVSVTCGPRSQAVFSKGKPLASISRDFMTVNRAALFKNGRPICTVPLEQWAELVPRSLVVAPSTGSGAREPLPSCSGEDIGQMRPLVSLIRNENKVAAAPLIIVGVVACAVVGASAGAHAYRESFGKKRLLDSTKNFAAITGLAVATGASGFLISEAMGGSAVLGFTYGVGCALIGGAIGVMYYRCGF